MWRLSLFAIFLSAIAFSADSVWVENRNNCAILRPGQKMLVQQTADSSPTRLPINYVLNHLSDHDYAIEIPIIFVSEAQYSEEKALQEKILSCTDPTKFYLLGPNNERLFFKPLFQTQYSETQYNQIQQKITATDDERSTSTTFSRKMDCATVYHELLHHTGLVDEYPEQNYAHKNSASGRYYNCRVTGPDFSIMNQHTNALEKYFEQWVTDKIEYSVGQNSESVRVFIKTQRFNLASRQQIEEMAITKLLNILKVTHQDLNPRELRIKSHTLSFEKNNAGLLPGHFNVITRPGCEAVNKTYYKCAQYSYKTTNDQNQCRIPPECQNHDWLLK